MSYDSWEVACAASWAACAARARLLGERSLASLLLRPHLRDLVLDGREELVLLRDLRLDRLLLRCLLGDDPRLVGARLLEVLATCLDLLAVLLDRVQDPRVLARDALDRVEPGDDVVEALRAEDHLERRVALAVDVEVAEALLDALLRDDEALPGGREVLRVRHEVGVDAIELDVRVVPRLDRRLELVVHALDLGDDRLGLGTLRLDRSARTPDPTASRSAAALAAARTPIGVHPVREPLKVALRRLRTDPPVAVWPVTSRRP